MRLARVMFVVVLVGFFAGIVRADATDPIINLHEPDPPGTCPAGAYCVNLSYDNTTASPIVFVNLLFPSVPPSGVSDEPYPLYSCDASFTPPFPAFTFVADPSGNPTPPPNILFLGCLFTGTLPTGVSTFTISADGAPVVLGLPAGFTCPDGGCSGDQINLTPEMGTSFLFMTGLLFLSLAGFARKRFGANHVT
jgi:hypothetical protein